MSVRQILDSTGKIGQAFLPTYIQNDLQSPVAVAPNAPATAGNVNLIVNGDQTSVYGGGITINPGRNNFAPDGAVGLNIHAGEDGVLVEVGTDGVAGTRNFLHIAGPDGLGEVYDAVYNPVAPYVEANPGEFTSTPETINNAAPSNTVRTIPLGDTPVGYNLFQVFLDINTTLAYASVEQPLIRIYLSDTINGAYDAAKAITTWVQPAAVPTGTVINLSDIPLFFSGVPATNNLYINITFANSPLPGEINANFSQTTTDYSVIAQKALAM
jgi:hypothetical protein